MTASGPGRETMVALIRRYFDAMDRGDVDATLECFADDAVLISEGQMYLRGRAAIREFLEQLLANSISMAHTETALITDPTQGRAVAEIRYTNSRHDFADIDMNNCNIFEFDASGRFVQVRFWVGDPAQLTATR